MIRLENLKERQLFHEHIYNEHRINILYSMYIDADRLVLIKTEDETARKLRIENLYFISQFLDHADFAEFSKTLNGNEIKELARISNDSEHHLNPSASFEDNPNASHNAIKKANNIDEIRTIIAKENFTSKCDLNDYDIILMQSILLHNPARFDELLTLAFDSTQDSKKTQEVVKNIAIASLINPILHDKAKDALKPFTPHQFNDFDKNHIQQSLLFLCARIQLFIKNNQDDEALKQFDLLKENLRFYGEKLDLKIQLPENIIEALETSKSRFDLLAVKTKPHQSKIGTSDFPIIFGGEDPMIKINQITILETLKKTFPLPILTQTNHEANPDSSTDLNSRERGINLRQSALKIMKENNFCNIS